MSTYNNGGLTVRDIDHKIEREDRFDQTFVQGMFESPLPEVFPLQRCKACDMQNLESPCRVPRLFLMRFTLRSRVLRQFEHAVRNRESR